MGARTELNKIHIVGSLGVAGLLGLLTGSFAVFAIASAVMIGSSVYAGEIRGNGNMRSGDRRRGR
jgi:hypothetical protein